MNNIVRIRYMDFETMEKQIETSKFIPEKAKQIALARLDLVHKWLEFRRKSNIKNQADYDFCQIAQYDGFAFASSFGQSLPRLASSLECYAWRF